MTEEGLVKRFQFDLEMGRFKEYVDFDSGIVHIFKFNNDYAIYYAFKGILNKLGYRNMSEALIQDRMIGIIIEPKYKAWRQMFISEDNLYKHKINKVPKYIEDYAKGELKRYYD